MEKKIRVAGYCRYSSDDEFEQMRKDYVRIVDENPQWSLTAIYSDEKDSDKRTSLHRMIEDAQSGAFNLVLIKTMSHLSNNIVDGVKVISALRDLPKPVGVQILDLGMNTLDVNADVVMTVLAMAEQMEKQMGQDVDELWSAVCGNDQKTIREYFENGGERNLRYRAFGRDHSLIMGAYRNGHMDMCELLISYGETVTDEEKEELLAPEKRRRLIGMLGIA